MFVASKTNFETDAYVLQIYYENCSTQNAYESEDIFDFRFNDT